MPNLIIHPSGPLRGTVAIPGDKSITHRALILASLAEGETRIHGWVPAEVCLATLRSMTALGVNIAETAGTADAPDLLVQGVGLHGLTEPADVLHCAGSGTTIRLLAGLLAGQPFTSVLTGAEPLRRRPMGRVAEPLRQMGATILGRAAGRLAPLTIRGGNLHAIDYPMPVASAQVKSALLLAGLFAEGETIVREPGPSRDHTERMLAEFGVAVKVEAEKHGRAVMLQGGQRLVGGRTIAIPGDFSSAAFPLVAAAIVPGSAVQLTGVGINPTRTGLWDLLLAMAAQMAAAERSAAAGGEPIGDLRVEYAPLTATEAHGELVVRSIDEFPIFAVAATQAAGVTVVRQAEELRVKESDRIATVARELRTMGATIEEQPDGMIVHGPARLHGATVECHRDHRLAMALAVAGLVAQGPTTVLDAQAIGDSFPTFVETLQALGADIRWDGQ